MKISTKINEREYVFDTASVEDISIPLKFNEDQPNTYGVPIASARPYESNGFIGDTRKGGGCNFEQIQMTPHCNGTHTECIGHITHERFSVHEQLKDSLIPATLISLKPVEAKNTTDQYRPAKESRDLLISKEVLQDCIGPSTAGFLDALIIRTYPNGIAKKSRNYMDEEPCFFSLEAIAYLLELGVKHLLVDMPSVDRLFDDGNLNVHHQFWNIEEGQHAVTSASHVHKTITEMIYVKEEIQDGLYLLNLQIAPFQSDAAPSRPLLYPLIAMDKG